MRYHEIFLEDDGNRKKRTSDAEFIQMARTMFGDRSAKLSLSDLVAVADSNNVQIPSTIRQNRALKTDANHWNLSGGDGQDVDKKVAKDLGIDVEQPSPDETKNYSDVMRVNTAKAVSRLAATGKLYLFGRKPKGAFFRVPGLEEYTAQLERMLSRELEAQGDGSMEEQYSILEDKVKLVAGGESQFIKSLLITGAPSSGKTYTVMKTIKDLGITDYIVKKGRITVLSLYRTLIEQINGLTIFDDCDSVVEDKNGINMLKGALDTDPVRELSYDVRGTVNTAVLNEDARNEYVDCLSRALRYKDTSEDLEFFKEFFGKMGILNKIMKIKPKKAKAKDDYDEGGDDISDEIGDDDEIIDDSGDGLLLDYVRTHLPNKIDFKGRIIFISNMDEDEWDSAILTRAIHQNMNFRSDEMLDFIEKVQGSIKTPGLTDEQKQETIDYIRQLWQTGKLKKTINFRLIQQAFDMRLTSQWAKLIGQL